MAVTTVRHSAATAAVHARRVIFIDLARALAVLFMLYGHAVDALLAPAYRAGLLYDVWQFQRGLTSCLFLLLSGFAFSIATARHWAAQLTVGAPVLRRARRFLLFVVLGYALHFPVYRIVDLPRASEAQWQQFLAVDVLQLIGATFMLVQLLVLVLRSRRAFMTATLLLAAAVVALTPWAWTVRWGDHLPPWAAAYAVPSTGSQFPLFPWAAFILAGTGLGQVYSRWGAAHMTAYANYALLVPGALLTGAILSMRSAGLTPFAEGPGGFVPDEVLIRTGVCLLLLGAIAHASRWIGRLPHVFGAVAQETLLIYFAHLCVVYGSIWNTGLVQVYGLALAPRGMVLTVVLLVTSMTALAWYWNWWKHTRPVAARWVAVGLGGFLVYRLL